MGAKHSRRRRSRTDNSRWNVDNGISTIRDFVEDKLRNIKLNKTLGRQYQIGRAYYQLTKTEEVQASKDMVILDKSTNALYGGQEARSLLGCPTGISFKIKPAIHGHQYDIFIKSTSVNRKLINGTKLLYFVGR